MSSNRLTAAVAKWAAVRWVQVLVATLFALGHLLAFTAAAHSRLHVPFDFAPGEHLQFSNPNVDALSAFPRQPPKWSRLAVSRLDAQHYIGAALRDIQACPTDPSHANGTVYLHCGLGWLPAFGLVGRVVMKLTGLEPDAALVLVSVLSAILLNVLWLSRTMVRRMGLFEAYAVMIAWSCYPGSLYLVTPLTEGLTTVLVMGGFIALANERWLLSGLLIGASTALRLPTAAPAFALGCCLLLAAWDRRKAGTPRWWRPLLAVPLCGWGQFAELLWFQLRLHNWRAFLDARFAYGDRNRFGRFLDVTYFIRGITSQAVDMVVWMALLAITVIAGRRALAGFSRNEKVFILIASAITFILGVAAPTGWWGMTRYMLLCPLPFIAMGTFAREHRAAFIFWLCVSVAIYWHFELCSYIAVGDPAACPCQGHIDLRQPWQS